MRTRRAQCLGLRRGPLDSHTQPPRTVAPKLIGRSGIDFSYGHWARRSCSPRTHVGRVRCARAARGPPPGRMRSCNLSSWHLGFQGNPSHHSLTLRSHPSDNVAPVLVRLRALLPPPLIRGSARALKTNGGPPASRGALVVRAPRKGPAGIPPVLVISSVSSRRV